MDPNKTNGNAVDRTYTRMLRACLNVSWSKNSTKARLYGPLRDISSVIREIRMRLAGQCWRSKDELVSDTILWVPKRGKAKVGRPYIDQWVKIHRPKCWYDATSDGKPTGLEKTSQ